MWRLHKNRITERTQWPQAQSIVLSYPGNFQQYTHPLETACQESTEAETNLYQRHLQAGAMDEDDTENHGPSLRETTTITGTGKKEDRIRYQEVRRATKTITLFLGAAYLKEFRLAKRHKGFTDAVVSNELPGQSSTP